MTETTTAPLAQHKRPGFCLTVYPNRIEIEEGAIVKKKTVVPLRNVATVEKHAMTSRVTIRTNDNKSHTWSLALDTAKVYDAIMGAL